MSEKLMLRKPLILDVDGVQERFEAGDEVPVELFSPNGIKVFVRSGHIDPDTVPSAKNMAEAAKAQRKADVARANADKEEKESVAAKASAEIAARKADREAEEAEEAARVAREAEAVVEAPVSRRGRKRKEA